MRQWDLSEMKFVAQVEIPDEMGQTSVVVYPPIFSDPEMMDFMLIGTTLGNMFFYNWEKRTLCTHRLSRQTLLKKDCPITSIDFHPIKPHRILICFYERVLHIYSINKHESIRVIEGKPFASACFQKKSTGEVMIIGFLKSGYFEVYKEEGNDS